MDELMKKDMDLQYVDICLRCLQRWNVNITRTWEVNWKGVGLNKGLMTWDEKVVRTK